MLDFVCDTIPLMGSFILNNIEQAQIYFRIKHNNLTNAKVCWKITKEAVNRKSSNMTVSSADSSNMLFLLRLCLYNTNKFLKTDFIQVHMITQCMKEQ